MPETPEPTPLLRPEAVVVDTSFFTNPQTRAGLGDTTEAAFRMFVDRARHLQDRVQFYMPPSVFEELTHFLDPGTLPRDTELILRLRPPRRFQIVVPGFLLYELIDEIRERINRGLRVAEEAVRSTQEQDVAATINALRNRYRRALREGIIDSREDVDLILLAMELDAALLTSDQGIMRWAERLGVRIVHPEAFVELLLEQHED